MHRLEWPEYVNDDSAPQEDFFFRLSDFAGCTVVRTAKYYVYAAVYWKI